MTPHIAKFREHYTDIGRSVVKNLFVFIACLIQGKTVNLYNLRDEVGKITEKYKTTSGGHYKRLSRFLQANSTSKLWHYVLKYGISLLKKNIRVCYLDATEWEIGNFQLHILTLAIDYQGVAIPIYFQVYEHKGVLSEKERIKFLQIACTYFPLQKIILIADREFIGKEWFEEMHKLQICFICRVRRGMFKNQLIAGRSYEKLQARARKKKRASILVNSGLNQYRLWLVHKQDTSTNEEFIYIITNVLDKQQIPNLYRMRWKIELLFKHLKTNGYRLEDLRIKDLNKIRLIFAMLSLTYILAILAALNERKNKPMKQKKYKDQRYFDMESVFKQGQSLLKQRFISLKGFLCLVQFLENTSCYYQPINLIFVQ
jgi:hypothetical protein